MPAIASKVPATWLARMRSAPSSTKTASVETVPLVSTYADSPPNRHRSDRATVTAFVHYNIPGPYNEGMCRRDILAFWVGDPAESTPELIRKSGTDSIGAGELFYTHNHGIPQLPGALAEY